MGDRDDVVEWTKGQSSQDQIEDFVSIYSQGRIGIPKSVFSELLGSPEAVSLKFAKESQEIGITPTDPDDPNGYSIGSDNRYITCSAFLETFDLDTDESVRHLISDSNGTLWIDTTEMIKK